MTGEACDQELSCPAPQDLAVEMRTSHIHGHGVFARQLIPSGERVIEYVGERISKAESLKRCEAMNFFIFALDEESDLDGSVETNLARYINHSCAPNCEADPTLCGEGRCGADRVCHYDCTTDADCSLGSTCSGGYCLCTAATRCATDMACNADSGYCGCTSDAICGPGHVCDTSWGVCTL